MGGEDIVTDHLIYDRISDDGLTMFYLLICQAHKDHLMETDLYLEKLLSDENIPATRIIKTMQEVMTIKGVTVTDEFDEYEVSTRASVYYNTIDSFSYSAEEKKIHFRLTIKTYMNLTNFYRDFNLKSLANNATLKGKYAKRLYQLLNAHRYSGYYSITLDKLFEELRIPEGYPTKEISRVILKPAIKQIQNVEEFKELRFRYYGLSRKAEEVIFEWKEDRSIFSERTITEIK